LQWKCCIYSLMYVEPYILTENAVFIWYQGMCKNNLFSDLAMIRTMYCNNNNHVVTRYKILHRNQNRKGGDFELPNRMKTPLLIKSLWHKKLPQNRKYAIYRTPFRTPCNLSTYNQLLIHWRNRWMI
jgi:hypothetical protein